LATKGVARERIQVRWANAKKLIVSCKDCAATQSEIGERFERESQWGELTIEHVGL